VSLLFGVGTLKGYRNGVETGCAVTTGGANTGAAVASGEVWLGGVRCQLSAVNCPLGATLSGTGKWIIAVMPSGNTSTAAVTAVFEDPTGMIFAQLDRFSYGTAANKIELLTGAAGNSAISALQTFGRLEKVSLNITYDQALARGGTMVFSDDMKMFNGNIEGNAEFAEVNVEDLGRILGGNYASGGNASGTWTLSATNKPFPFAIVFQDITDGVTGTFKLFRCFSSQLSLAFDRENYLVPNFNFVAVANQDGRIGEFAL
jgi:hypothetical protein